LLRPLEDVRAGLVHWQRVAATRIVVAQGGACGACAEAGSTRPCPSLDRHPVVTALERVPGVLLVQRDRTLVQPNRLFEQLAPTFHDTVRVPSPARR
jgi:hypothetical protein